MENFAQMKSQNLWLSVPLVLMLLTACNTATQSEQTSNKSGSTANSTSNQVAIAKSNFVSPSANPANVIATGPSSIPNFATQVFVTANNYATKSQNIVYPQLHGLPDASDQSKLNALLKKNAIYVPTEEYAKPGSYTYTSSYHVVFEQGTIMNIVYSSYFYSTGAAHGMPAHNSLILNLKTGQTYSLNDMFQPRSNYLQQISQVVEKADKSHALDTFQKFTGVTSKDTIFLREGGFVVDFSPYEWASYAQGFLDYYVPFSSLQNVVDTTSSMWAALNDSAGFPETNYRSEEAAKISSLGYSISLNPEDETTVSTANGDSLTALVGGKLEPDSTALGSEYIFFFLNGKYLGTDTSLPHYPIGGMYPDGHGTIAVNYYNLSSNGTTSPFTIHYHWNGSKLIAEGSFPSGFDRSK
jgi:hypothetical protein